MFPRSILVLSFGVASFLAGCQATDTAAPRAHQPGPALGHAVGTPVQRNLVGAYVPTNESVPAPASVATSTNERRLAREWRYETTPDGRTIRVAYETEVDAQGQPIGPSKPVKY